MDRLAQMKTFQRVVETGSLTAAARQLRLSVAAISRQIADLEAQLGTSLVVRSTRRLAMTEAGTRYYASCVRILRDVESAEDDARSARTVSGLLTVSAPVSFGLERVWPKLPELARAHPGLRIDLRLEDHVVDLIGDGVDVALRLNVAAPDASSVIAHALGTTTRCLVASAAWLKKHGEPRSPAGLARLPCVVHLASGDAPVPWRFTRDAEVVVVEPSATLRTTALLAIRQAVLAGQGLAVLPRWLVEEDLAARRLRVVLPAWELPPVHVAAVHRADLRGAPRVRVFLDHLRRTWSPT